MGCVAPGEKKISKESATLCDVNVVYSGRRGPKFEVSALPAASGWWAHSSAMMMEAAGSFEKSVSHTGDSNHRSHHCKSLVFHVLQNQFVVVLFSWRYNPLLYFHSPVAGVSLLVFEVS